MSREGDAGGLRGGGLQEYLMESSQMKSSQAGIEVGVLKKKRAKKKKKTFCNIPSLPILTSPNRSLFLLTVR